MVERICVSNHDQTQSVYDWHQQSVSDIDVNGCLAILAQSEEFKSGVLKLAKMFQLPSHEDHILLFKAISILIEERLSHQAMAKTQQEKKGQSYEKGDVIPLSRVDLGFTISGSARESIISVVSALTLTLCLDPVLNEAAKVLRLLHVAELRDLQTKINEIIVAVQKLTADPKTDQRLGKVGV